MGFWFNLRREVKKQKITENYQSKNRLINSVVYNKLKANKTCNFCCKKFNNEKPEIHHIIPVSEGGSNEELNLVALHKKCHKQVHKEMKKFCKICSKLRDQNIDKKYCIHNKI